MRSTSNFLTGLLLGVGAGMLLAPKTGKELRDQVEQAFKGDGTSGGGDWKQKLNQVVDQIKSQVNQVMSQVQGNAGSNGNGNGNYSSPATPATPATSSMTPQDVTRQQYNTSIDPLADDAGLGYSGSESPMRTDRDL
ncbi:YtxH domain-containing protein [Tellurirhabdus rosea]|uniref:YtxH domain-containing protein n=1 Tax=Tellurirhabdus rosea TaxID=2674997 RepID=UPI00225A65C2|nr:YtxH domain-containing protein [Tellurirhabdus rosea]